MHKLLIILLCVLLVGCMIDQNDFSDASDVVPMIQIVSSESDIMKVVYPNINGEGEDGFGYKVLALALDKSGVDYELTFDDTLVNNDRIRQEISSGKISIADFGYQKEYEADLRAIYIPIDKGLNGMRICLINQTIKDDFIKSESIEDLSTFTFGQGLGWADTVILRDNGLEVTEAQSLESAFEMLNNGRFDVMPLGANEAKKLLELYDEYDQIVLDEAYILRYPFFRVFFVSKDNNLLYESVLEGLSLAIRDGSFDELFEAYYGLDGLLDDMQTRRIIELKNDDVQELYEEMEPFIIHK
ncbi:transporter substrate-binding domain-containing protein [Acidaminobacter sp. JC074]|uniref:transporter substrate-binding domain-containing protein n=1 Tax=Acidaminobacter sp. JC074 TaxID=2530199 RepID=UPI001F0DD5BF|nr:transporter substrate-binding domain-containing protein [Acidaminobacter sp. JC074]